MKQTKELRSLESLLKIEKEMLNKPPKIQNLSVRILDAAEEYKKLNKQESQHSSKQSTLACNN